MKLVLAKHVAFADPVLSVALAGASNRVIVGFGDKPMLVLDASTGKEIVKLPRGSHVASIDRAGTLAAVSEDGKSVGGRYMWNISLWDLVKGKKIAALSKNHPDDNITPEAIGPTRIIALHKKKNAYSLALFDRAGKKVGERPLGKVPLPFHVAFSPDEGSIAHAYFTGAAQIADVMTGKGQKLAGGVLRIGRQHDKGISELAFDDAGDHVMYLSSGSETAHVWNARTRKSVAGTWVGAAAHEAFFVGASLVIARSGSQDAIATVHALDPKAKTKPRAITLGAGSMHIASAGDARHLACAGNTAFDAYAKHGLQLFDLVKGTCAAKATLPASMRTVHSVSAAPGRIAVGDRKGGVALFTF